MRKIVMGALAAGALLPLSVGCCKNSQVVRGQSPQEMQPRPAAPAQPGMSPGGPVAGGAYGGPGGAPPYCPPGMNGGPAGASPYGPPGMYGGAGGEAFGAFGGPDAAYKRGNRWCGPTSYNMYPPPGDVPAVVQYPYYTTKGPDDFFLK